MLDALRAQHAVSKQLHVDHVAGPTEAMLWVPDAICGAVVRHRLGDTIFFQAITARVPADIITI